MNICKLSGLLAAAALLLSGCGAAQEEPLTYTGTALDTVISIQIYGTEDRSLLEHCQTLCEDYESKLSRTIDSSEISRINRAGGEAVEVSDETVDLIKEGISYGELSDGAFDITIGAVSSLWDFKSEDPEIPSDEELAEAVSHVDYTKIRIDGNRVQLTDPEASLDLGAIAKGYIADRIKDYLKDQGISHGLINLGGNVLAIGKKPDGTDFHIGIQKPFDTDGEPITAVDIDDQSAVTSGTYQRCFQKDGVLYHHILNSSDGMPVNNGLSSVTIITESSLTADALSTTCFLLGPDEGMKLVNRLDGVEAVMIDTDNTLTWSDGLKK